MKRYAVPAAALLLAGCIGLEEIQRPVKDPADDTGPDEVRYGDLVVTPASVDFGDVHLGQSGTASVVVGFEGDGAASLDAASIDGGQGAIIVQSVTTTLPTALVAGDEVVLELQFTPSLATHYAAVLTLDTDVEEAEQIEIPLGGDGVDDGTTPGGSLVCAPRSLDFGIVDVGDMASRSFTVSNIGSDDVLIMDVETGVPTLEAVPTFALPWVLSPGTSKEVAVEWTPSAVGNLSSTVTVLSDDPVAPETSITATGEAQDLCDICAPVISVDTGGSDAYTMDGFFSFAGIPDTRDLTISNVGDEPLSITSVYVNNDFIFTAGTFSVNWGGSRVDLDPGRSHRLQVSFRATGYTLEIGSTATDTNVLHILSNDLSQRDYVITLGGAGI